MNAMKAPKGGMVSKVNGRRYEGGEFIPDHGHCCGQGKNRVTKTEMDDFAARLMAAKGWSVRYNESLGRFQLLLPTGNVMTSAASLKTLACFAE